MTIHSNEKCFYVYYHRNYFKTIQMKRNAQSHTTISVKIQQLKCCLTKINICRDLTSIYKAPVFTILGEIIQDYL